MGKIMLFFLIGTATMFSQTVNVRGVTLTYDKAKKTLTLTTTRKIMYTNDYDMDVRIKIDKEFYLKINIGGINYSTSDSFFEHSGHVREMGWSFTTYKPIGCREIKKNYIFQFTNVEPGEYILTVSNVCDEKYVTNEKSGSIIIN